VIRRLALGAAAALALVAILAPAAAAPTGSTILCCDTASGACSVSSGNLLARPAGSGALDPICPLPSGSSATLAIELAGGGSASGLRVLTERTEPPAGFVGVCVARSVSYAGTTQLPLVCWEVVGDGPLAVALAIVTLGPSYPIAAASPALMGCYAHAPGTCAGTPSPQVTLHAWSGTYVASPVSRSCCDDGEQLGVGGTRAAFAYWTGQLTPIVWAPAPATKAPSAAGGAP
jgi:hypothetical protein